MKNKEPDDWDRAAQAWDRAAKTAEVGMWIIGGGLVAIVVAVVVGLVISHH